MKHILFAGVALVVVCGACSNGESGGATPTVIRNGEGPAEGLPTRSATTAAAPSPEALAFPNAKTLVAGSPVAFPDEVVVYAFDGVWEGPSTALRRYYTDPLGALIVDDLILSTFDDGGRAFVGMAVGAGGEMAASLCHGYCYGEPQPVTVVRSDDGGVTWRDVVTVERGWWDTIEAINGDEIYLRGLEPSNMFGLWRLAGDAAQEIQFPAEVNPNAAVYSGQRDGALVIAGIAEDRRTLWNLVTGEVLVSIPLPDSVRSTSLTGFISTPNGLRFQVGWSEAAGDHYVGLLDLSTGGFDAIYRMQTDDGLEFTYIAGWLSATVAIGRASFRAADYLDGSADQTFRGIPALIDFGTGVVSPIADFVPKLAGKSGGPVPRHIAVGAFARVSTPEDCLNVRATPSTTGEILACYADGVLLPLRDDAAVAAARYLVRSTPSANR
ncbi:MAG: hypothetical protein KJ048_03255 [Dehalococcoidia bacterium]|nr:hypothetical protein [Dehalococcoidia bacterium]